MIKLYGENVSRLLNIQYRMNEKIMQFSSDELYQSKLLAHESVKSHLISDLNNNVEENLKNNSDNIVIKLENKLLENDNLEISKSPLIFIDTNNYQFFETSDADSLSKFNMGEGKICKFFVDYLKSIGINLTSIGVITPYSAQVSYLRSLMTVDEYQELEISTVDGFQGREKEIIILNLVRSNKKHEVGFLADKRRLNVAVTRAKRMCVLICDSSTVNNDKFINKMTEYFTKNSLQIEINFNIFDHKEIEDIQLESDLTAQKNEKKKLLLQKEEMNLRKNAKDSNNNTQEVKKKKKNKKNKKVNEEGENNLKLGQEVFVEEIYNKNEEYLLNSNPYLKKEISLDFTSRIEAFIDDFILSDEIETIMEGLDNAERRHIHVYAELKKIIHESRVRKIL